MGISRLFQKLLRYFNETAISTSTVLSLPALFVNLYLNLNYLESFTLSSDLFLQYCHPLTSTSE